MDIKSINIPDMGVKDSRTDVYVYADFLKPGYHQVLIYDPAQERAFCKDFIVNLNLREDIYPEYPIPEGLAMKKRIKWIWRHWV